MAIFLRILTVFYMILSIASLALGSMLFARRELLKGRTQKLEETLIEVGAFIEEEDAPEIENDFAARDADDVSAQQLEAGEIEYSPFWDSYDLRLEDQERTTVNLRPKRDVLMAYYKRDFTGKVEKDLATGFPITKGKGTMHDLIEDFKVRVEKQHTRLNMTRQQLTILREETETVIGELNERKSTLRTKLAQIVMLNNTIADLNSRIADLQSQISSLQLQIRGLEDEVAVRDTTIQKLREDVQVKESDIAGLKEEITELRATNDRLSTGGGGGSSARTGSRNIDARHVQPGLKGKVVSVNSEWGYVVFKTTPEFVAELDAINATLARHLEDGELPAVPSVELLVKRGSGTFITKLRMRQLDRESMLGIADIMSDWQQKSIKPGDRIFY